MAYRILDVDVTAPRPRVALGPDETGLAVLVRRAGRPVAFWMEAVAPGSTLSPAEVDRRVAERAGESVLADAIRAELAPSPARAAPPDGGVTVAVCTRDRPKRLARCLDGIDGLSRRPDAVLVVDNAPSNNRTRTLVVGRPQVDYVREVRPGLNFARNRSRPAAPLSLARRPTRPDAPPTRPAIRPPMRRAPRSSFLSQNPFPHPLTFGFFYREKMRAIHRVAPAAAPATLLDVGGGRSGLASLLYPSARVTVVDLDAAHADAPCNRRPNVTFRAADATDLPFPDDSFEAVTLFDLIEHVPDDRRALREALRVLRPGGVLLLSTPNADWRYPHYRFMDGLGPDEAELFAEWGHVRRGYARARIEALVGRRAEASASFISPLTVLCHDVAFSNLPRPVRTALCWALLPLTWTGYLLHRPHHRGTETAYRWRLPGRLKADAPPQGDRENAPAVVGRSRVRYLCRPNR
jgi:SAM-dependent methyltransferase